ncbi:MAG: hypothetical protein GQ544_04145 [Candidatus Aminicenantes bacterium]|nr:hypothetical protein [Candidatus Aminicenantes bacterium]
MHSRRRSPYLFLILLVIICSLGLDYIQMRKGNSAYLFRPHIEKPEVASEENLGEIVHQSVLTLGITEDAISQYRDSEGIQHMMIMISPALYTDLERLLDKELAKREATATKKTREHTPDNVYHLWSIQGKDNQRLSLLVSRPPEPVITTPREKPVPAQPERPKIAIIIDDMGNSLDAIYEICALNENITVAVLPYSPLAHETASIARQNGLEVILHLPLESLNNVYDNNNTEGIILSDMSSEEIEHAVANSLTQVPYITGVNTHMGSKVTSHPEVIRKVLEQIQGKELYFIDSRTTARSVAYDVAQELGIPSGFRHVFLDSEFDEIFIRRQLMLLFRHAQENGSAIAICHPSPETLKVLKESLYLAAEYNLQTVFASEIVQ